MTVYLLIGCSEQLFSQDTLVYTPPLFKGCSDPLISLNQQLICTEDALRQFIQDSIVYPPRAIQQKKEGIVVLRLNISDSGAIDIIEVVTPLSQACNSEAIRIAHLIPVFIPAKKNGQAIDTSILLPFSFTLVNEALVEELSSELLLGTWVEKVFNLRKHKIDLDAPVLIRTINGAVVPANRLLLIQKKKNKVRTFLSIGALLSPKMKRKISKANRKTSFILKAYGASNKVSVKAQKIFFVRS